MNPKEHADSKGDMQQTWVWFFVIELNPEEVLKEKFDLDKHQKVDTVHLRKEQLILIG